MTYSGGEPGGQLGGGTPVAAESKESAGGRSGEAAAADEAGAQRGEASLSFAESKTSAEWLTEGGSKGATATAGDNNTDSSSSSTNPPGTASVPVIPPPPELHVLLSPELTSDMLESFIDFFAGVAVPPHFSPD
ncbi:unnamed protein product, partial [Sphacelaria rigidula]